jgi:hypothetical protein
MTSVVVVVVARKGTGNKNRLEYELKQRSSE